MAAATTASIRIECQEKGGLRRVHEVHVPVDATVQAVREALAPLARAKVAGLLLFDGDEYLQNAVRLSDYEIADGARLLFEARMCGILPADHDWSASAGIKTKRIRGL
jgi:hypothetical protein